AEEMGYDNYDTLSLHPTYHSQPRQPGRTRVDPNQLSLFDMPGFEDNSQEQPERGETPAEPVASQLPKEQTHTLQTADTTPAAPTAPTTQTSHRHRQFPLR
ncbi:MAG: hypothetical protein U0L09_03765, partial [Christensenellales bacterium]|nr:hypothetical protein [Christensenellales bacterium]